LVTVDVVVPNVAVVTEELVTVEEVEFVVVRPVAEELVSFPFLVDAANAVKLISVGKVEFVVRLVVEEPVSFTALVELLVCVELVDLVEFVPFTCGR